MDSAIFRRLRLRLRPLTVHFPILTTARLTSTPPRRRCRLLRRTTCSYRRHHPTRRCQRFRRRTTLGTCTTETFGIHRPRRLKRRQGTHAAAAHRTWRRCLRPTAARRLTPRAPRAPLTTVGRSCRPPCPVCSFGCRCCKRKCWRCSALRTSRQSRWTKRSKPGRTGKRKRYGYGGWCWSHPLL